MCVTFYKTIKNFFVIGVTHPVPFLCKWCMCVQEAPSPISCIWFISCVRYLAEGSWLLLPGPAAHGTCPSASRWTQSSLSAGCVAPSVTPAQLGPSPNSAPAHHVCDSSHWLAHLAFLHTTHRHTLLACSSISTKRYLIVVKIYWTTSKIKWLWAWNGLRLNRLEMTWILLRGQKQCT